MLTNEGVDCLPLVIVDHRVVSDSEYPAREHLSLWTGTMFKAKSGLPIGRSRFPRAVGFD